MKRRKPESNRKEFCKTKVKESKTSILIYLSRALEDTLVALGFANLQILHYAVQLIVVQSFSGGLSLLWLR